MSNMHWIITAIIMPVPVFHLWLHGLLPHWKKQPFFFYVFCTLLWIGSYFIFRLIGQSPPLLFASPKSMFIAGRIFMIVGPLGVICSISTLGIKRFFMWAVFKPSSAPKTRITKGIFSFTPHPAYFGYLIIALGNFLSEGFLYLGIVLIALLAMTPVSIWLEEKELEQRTVSG